MENNKNILSVIRGEIRDFLYNDIEIVPGYNFNQYNTLKRCHLYINSRFEDNSLYQGKQKIFFNISKPVRDVTAKFLNVDTKDIKTISRSGSDNPYKTLIAQKELDLYLKENDYAQKLNDMADRAADFGSVVIKTIKGKPEIVDLRRMFNDPTVDTLQKSRFLTFKHLFTVSELREKKKQGWDSEVIERICEWKQRQDNVSTAGTSYENDGQINVIRSSPYIEVYERFGEVEQWMLDDKGTNQELVKSLFIVVEPMSTFVNTVNNVTEENGGVLFKSKWIKEYPVDEYHFYKTPGRWLGIGPVESLFIPQERMNEIRNQKRVSMEISTLHLFQTQDNTIVNNLLSDLQNGDVIITSPNGTIQPIANEERNLAAFNDEEQDYQTLADRISFVNDQAAGAAVPSSTPATNAVIQQNNTVSIFNFKRQNFANFVRRFLRKFVLNDLLTNMNEEHILRFVGSYEETIKLNMAVATSYATAQSRREFLLEGKPFKQEEYQFNIQKNLQELKGRAELHYQIKKAWFDDVDLDFDILIDNEQQSTDVLANNTFQVIQAISANPEALQNPVLRALIFDYAEKIGINPAKLESMDMGQPTQPQGQSMPQSNVQSSPVGQGAMNQAKLK